MKNFFLIVVVILTGTFSLQAQTTDTFDLTVNISGLGSDKGSLLVGLYNTKESFLKDQFKGVIVKIKNKESVAIFKNIPKGEYAVSFVHDENDNKKMDTNFIGIPKEDYGCSNNTRGFMGAPKYDNAKFNLEGNKTISIEI